MSEILLILCSLVIGWAIGLVSTNLGYRMGRETQGLATSQFRWREDAPERTKEDSGYADPWEEAASPVPNKGIETVER